MTRGGTDLGPVGSWDPVGSFEPGDTGAEPGAPGHPVPWHRALQRLALPLIVVAALVALIALVPPRTGLPELSMIGTRGPVCERVVLVVDQSGSMADIAGPRDAATGELLAWLPRNLRPDDELAIVDFASTARTRLPATRIADLGPGQAPAPVTVGQTGYTNLGPALSDVAALVPTSCDVDVLLLSDGQFADLPTSPGQGRALLLGAGVHDFHLLVPTENDQDPPAEWPLAFDGTIPAHFDGDDAEASALVVAEAVASCTGQTLARQPLWIW